METKYIEEGALKERRPLYLAPISEGMGDLVLSIPAIQYLVEQKEELYLVVRSPRQVELAHLIPGVAGVIREPDFAGRQEPSRYINLRDHPLQTDHDWGSSRFTSDFPDYTIVEILADIWRDFGIKANHRELQPLPCRILPELAQTVILVPGSNGPFKSWPTFRWLELAEILAEQKLDFKVVGTASCPDTGALLAAGLPHLPTPTLADALQAVTSCRSIVSVDTGLLHLGLQQGKRCVALYPNHLIFLRRDPNCIPLIADSCDPECAGGNDSLPVNRSVDFPEWSDKPLWHCGIADERRCLTRLSGQTVWQALKQSLRTGESNDNSN